MKFCLLFSVVLAAQPARAILESKCIVCHGQTRMAGLDLRDPAGLARGGSRGPAVVAGNAEASLLYKAVRREGELKMPPGREALSSEEVDVLRDWINSGARFDGSVSKNASWWSFRAPVRPRSGNSIDDFVSARAAAKGLPLAAEASRAVLARRAYFDSHGLPPAPEEVDAFIGDGSANAYEKLIDKLLASPRYGERWGRYWLDLVRYADTSGFETDHFFVNAWRYRDYVIRAFNADKPYDVFVKEQIAADEIWPMDVDLEGTSKLPKEKEENQNRRIATGLFTIGSFPIEYTYYGDQFRTEWAAEAVDTIGAAFLGLTVGCARCHDHKFDAISQRDYYSMTALFAGSAEREIQLGSLFDLQTSTRSFPLLAQAEAYKQMARRGGGNRAELLQKIGEAYLRAPARPPMASVLGHEEFVRDTHMLLKGDFKNKGAKVEPGFIAALNAGPAINEPKGVRFIPERRKALAEWLTAKDNPLLARVMVNRIWQGHFGEGLVRTPNDFGRQGEAPTNPELLDWLAVEFAEKGYSMKAMHKAILLSAAYRRSSVAPESVLRADPENFFLTRQNRRRLDADAIRDSTLAVAGTLNMKMGGVGVIPKLTAEELQAARMPNLWPVHPDPAEHNRRSVYLQMKRSLTLPMLQIFDAPDSSTSCARRERSTVAPQALAMMNSEFSSARAEEFAKRVKGADPIGAAWKIAFGRAPSADERDTAASYLERNSLPRLCLLILNMSEFIYVD
ncbi:MAG: DUF1553 domain-containing protein [Acidobacteria bacterium]|nr:DUF1553 domain-containing protein [Acidobacteriota bacterium]